MVIIEDKGKRKAEDANLEGQDNDGDIQFNLIEVIEKLTNGSKRFKKQ